MANYIGLMAGTSLDGVDGVIVGDSCKKIITTAYLPYPPDLKQKLKDLTQKSSTSLENLANIDIQVAKIFSKAVKKLLEKSQLTAQDIKAIGSHGQTVFHSGGTYSLQIGHGAFIKEQTNIKVISDFRTSDIAAGGQGAPLTPLYHQHLLNGKDAVVINLGGITNLTKIKDGEISGFDTGPANTLLDNWIKKHKNLDYDKDGLWARSGALDESLLTKMLSDKYFQKSPPKSTGVEYFNLNWLQNYLTGMEKPEDVQRTLVELTAMSISKHIPQNMDVYLCGGGVFNMFLAERLVYQNPSNKVETTNKLGIDPNYVEAAAFAFFAKQTLADKPANVPKITGAKGYRVLGGIYK